MRSWVCLLGVLWCQPALAQVLSLEEVLLSVERSYPLLEAERQKLAKAEGEMLSARGAFDTKLKGKVDPVTLSKKESYSRYDALVEQPTTLYGVSFYGGWSLGAGAFPDYYGEYVTPPGGEVFVGAVVPLLRGGAIDEARAALTQTSLEQEAVSAEVTQKRLWYRRAAAHKYWDWVAAGALLEVERRLLLLAEERDAAVHSRVKQGLLPEVEALDNERLVISRRAKVLEAELKLTQAALELSLYWRDAQGRPLVPEETRLPGWPEASTPQKEELARLLQTALSQRPELFATKARREQAGVSVSLAQNQRLPALDLTIEGAQLIGGGTELGAGLLFELPIQQRKARGSVEKATAEERGLSAQLTYFEDLIKTEVKSAFAALEVAARLVSLQQENLDAALRLAEAERTRFELGSSTLLVVNLREQSAAEAAAALIEAKRRYFWAQATLKAAVAE